MAELGQDISGHKPMTFEELEDWEGLNFDLIITLSPEAHHKALELTHTLAADVEYWPTPDPTGTEGSREQKLQAYREVCDGLMMRIRRRFSKVGARERVAPVVPANAGTHTPRPAEGAHWKTPSVQPATTVVAEYLRPRAIDGSRGMGPCVRRDDRDSGASTTTCSPVVEWSAFR